jgi:hypothetical protein
MHDLSLACLGTGISISGGRKLVLWIQRKRKKKKKKKNGAAVNTTTETYKQTEHKHTQSSNSK